MFCFPNKGHLIISRELFLSNYALKKCISKHKLWKCKGTSSPDTAIGKTKHTS